MMFYLIRILYAYVFFGAATAFASEARLEGIVSLIPPNGMEDERIIPSTPIQLQLTVRNVGDLSSSEGSTWVRYALPKPLDTQKGSILYASEKMSLPSIQPGEERVFAFKTFHYLPTIYDFIRNDWGMRKYEAVVDTNGKESVIGYRPLTFSAYYYLGPSRTL